MRVAKVRDSSGRRRFRRELRERSGQSFQLIAGLTLFLPKRESMEENPQVGHARELPDVECHPVSVLRLVL